MKRIFLLLLTTAAMITAAAQHIMLKNLVLDSCSVYPAVSHRYHVYIPDGYDGTSPAALYLGLDGVLCNAPAVLDSLIASGDAGNHRSVSRAGSGLPSRWRGD